MKPNKPKPTMHFPVMDGADTAPRESQIAGIVSRVWSDALVYHEDVEKLLREWLDIEHCVIADDEFQILLSKARGEFARVATQDTSGAPVCPAHTLVECLYWDVEQLERTRAN
jgi:hypothetical protein